MRQNIFYHKNFCHRRILKIFLTFLNLPALATRQVFQQFY